MEINSSATQIKNLNTLNLKHQVGEALAVNFSVYNTYTMNGKPTKISGQQAMTIKTCVDILDAKYHFIDIQK